MYTGGTTPQSKGVMLSHRNLVANALPIIIFTLTIRGNGATLVREEAAGPLCFFEVLFGIPTLEDLALQNGDVEEDWGGAIHLPRGIRKLVFQTRFKPAAMLYWVHCHRVG